MDYLKIEAAGSSKMLVPVNQTMSITSQTIILIFRYHNLLVLKGLIKYTSWDLKMDIAGPSVMLIYICICNKLHGITSHLLFAFYIYIYLFVFHIKH